MAFIELKDQNPSLENIRKLITEHQAKNNTAIVPVVKNGKIGLLEFSPQNIASRTKQDGGLSLDMSDDTNPTTGYAVACYPQLGTWIEANADDQTVNQLIQQFVTRNNQILAIEGNVLGTWLSDNPDTRGMIALDVSKIIHDKEEALRLGILHNQQSIFCLDSFEELPCGGTGYEGRPIMESECTEKYMPDASVPTKQDTDDFFLPH